MVLLSLTLSVVNCFVVIGNLMVFYVILTKKSLQTSTNRLVLSLTISDLLLGILILPFAIIQEHTNEWLFGHVGCRLWLSVDVFLSTASIYNLLAISFDRVVRLMTFLVWFCSLLLAVVLFVLETVNAQDTMPTKDCQPTTLPSMYIIFSAVASFIAPAFVMVILNARIFQTVLHTSRTMTVKSKNGSLRVHRRKDPIIPVKKLEKYESRMSQEEEGVGTPPKDKKLSDPVPVLVVESHKNSMDAPAIRTFLTHTVVFGVLEAKKTNIINHITHQIYRILKNNRDDDGVVHRQSPGRPRTTSRAMDRNILRACREDPRRTSTDNPVSVTSPNEPVPSRRTIRRRLQVAGLHGRRPVKKPLVSLKNRTARVEWAKQHLSWGPREWANHIWSDESKFNLFGTDGIQWIRRPIGSRYAPQYQCPTVKHEGGSVMVWGCFPDTSMGPLKRIVGTMGRYVYEDILENTMRLWARANLGRSWVFQQDNDPKHTSGHVANWFRRRRVDLLGWPSQSPDLNPIEQMWEELERRLKGVRASNANQKFAQLEAAWKSIPMTVVQTLLDSMPRRCQAVIDAKGYPTKKKVMRRSLRTEMRVARTTGIVVAAFIVCWIPFTTIYVLQAYSVCTVAAGCIPTSLFTIAFWLGYSNSAVNPILYAAFSRDFRVALKRLFFQKPKF
uniref:G_PROTEIN_RECEP_F1_2 domain-containing protein n=2 Tax=Caenorhabditis japonica TaxID=281687 RepID=A0A8R1I4B6_CAEJA